MPELSTAPTDLAPADPRVTDPHLWIGASWYPELWPEEEWSRDLGRMREIGFNVTRLFEFAWHRFEPSEGSFDADWARRVMDLCHEGGVGVMIGTPTAAPPAWLTHTYPEVLRVSASGKPHEHGQRKHGSHISPRYRDLCRGIVERMADALHDHPAVMGWQIDNEMGGGDYSPAAKEQFQQWLIQKYGSIERINDAWGLEFWSQAYSDPSQIPMPTAAPGTIEVPERHHPSLLMDLARFNSEMFEGYVALQCDVIREHSDKPITTNMTSFAMNQDWHRINRLLDRVGHSIYSDVDHYPWRVMNFDRMRPEKSRLAAKRSGASSSNLQHADPYRPYWLLETAPNWSGGGKQWNIHHNAAGLRAFCWMSTLLGGSMILFWQWRSHWAGQEMNHGTHVDPAGRWRPNRDTWAKLSADFREHGDWLLGHPPTQAQIGIFQSSEAAWAFSIDPLDDEMRYDQRFRDDYHAPLVESHYWRDILGIDTDEHTLENYRVLLMPHLPIVPADVRERLERWVRAGGRLLLGPLTGYRSETFTAFTDSTFGGLESLIGAGGDLGFSAHWREDAVRVEFGNDITSKTRGWCESFTPNSPHTETIAHYAGEGEYGDRRVAAVLHRLGDGRVITLGCMVEPGVYALFVRRLCDEVHVGPVAEGDTGVLVIPRGGTADHPAGYGVVNLTESPRTVTLPQPGVDRFTGQSRGPHIDLEPLEVLLLHTSVQEMSELYSEERIREFAADEDFVENALRRSGR